MSNLIFRIHSTVEAEITEARDRGLDRLMVRAVRSRARYFAGADYRAYNSHHAPRDLSRMISNARQLIHFQVDSRRRYLVGRGREGDDFRRDVAQYFSRLEQARHAQ